MGAAVHWTGECRMGAAVHWTGKCRMGAQDSDRMGAQDSDRMGAQETVTAWVPKTVTRVHGCPKDSDRMGAQKTVTRVHVPARKHRITEEGVQAYLQVLICTARDAQHMASWMISSMVSWMHGSGLGR